MNKHEQFIRNIAEEMAENDYNRLYRDDGSRISYRELAEWQKTSLLNKALPYARIAVKYMAEQVRQVCQQITAWDDTGINSELINRGLIPPTGKEAAEQDSNH